MGFMLSLFVTILVTTLGWYIIFLPFGLVQKMLQALGLISGPLKVLKTFPALVTVLSYLHMPYAILILVSSIQNVPEEKIDAAKILGAPGWKILLEIILPLTLPGIVSSAILVFALSASSFLVPILISGQSISLLPLTIWRYTNEILNWPFAAVNAIVLFVITILLTYGFIILTNKISRRGEWELV
jgi:putative spermidine/putrescine transport system permease protein